MDKLVTRQWEMFEDREETLSGQAEEVDIMLH